MCKHAFRTLVNGKDNQAAARVVLADAADLWGLKRDQHSHILVHAIVRVQCFGIRHGLPALDYMLAILRCKHGVYVRVHGNYTGRYQRCWENVDENHFFCSVFFCVRPARSKC